VARRGGRGADLAAPLPHRKRRDLPEGRGRAGRFGHNRQEQPADHSGVRPPGAAARPVGGRRPAADRPGRLRPVRGMPGALPDRLPGGAFLSNGDAEADPSQVRPSGRGAALSRDRCNSQMRADLRGAGAPGGSVLYCRRCEFACRPAEVHFLARFDPTLRTIQTEEFTKGGSGSMSTE